MRPLQVLVVIGVTSVAPAALAQESISIRLLDVPADYQALKPLATDWPPPVNTFYYRIGYPLRTRYPLGPTGTNFSSGNEIPRLRELRDFQLRIESLRNRIPSSAQPPTDTVPSPNTPPAADPGRER